MDPLSVERYLLEGAVVKVGPPIGHGAHPPCRVDYEDDDVVGLAKFPSLAREDDGHLMIVRERAAWVVAKALGWVDLVPPTVLRDLDGPAGRERASVQAHLEDADDVPPVDELDAGDIHRAAIFDVVIHAGDRLANWMGVRSEDGPPTRLRLVDHGHAFEMPGWGVIRSEFVRRREGTRIAKADLAALSGLTREDVRSELQALLTSEPVRRMMARVERLLQRSTVTRS
jgi:hypothetical protein